jgi:hypothetical protein
MNGDARHGMFLLQGDRLVGLDETPYDSEDLLQHFLARYPDLLAGHQIDPLTPRRWLLIDREVGIPDSPDAGGRWSLDHLFLDQDGIPTLVEVKRSTDTRIRREVVGQMLEYAANAIVHVPAERIRAIYEGQCATMGRDPQVVLAETFGEASDIEEYWSRVEENVRAHRLRLVFLADQIPPELARMVEYLNEQMRTTEVLAIELKQYTGGDLRTLVPRLIGRTATAEATKERSASRAAWDWNRFAESLAGTSGPIAVRRARQIHDWVSRHGRVWWGYGARTGGFVAMYDDPRGMKHQLFEVWTNGLWEQHFKYLSTKGRFVDAGRRTELRDRLNSVPGVAIPADAIARLPSIPLASLPDDAAVTAVLKVWNWVIEEIAKG